MARKPKQAAQTAQEGETLVQAPELEPVPQLPAVSIDRAHGGGANAKVVVGRLTGIDYDGEQNRILNIVDTAGGVHRPLCNNTQTLWTGLWSHGLTPMPELGLEGRGDQVAMQFCKLDEATQNEVLQTNGGMRRDTIFRIALDDTEEGTCIGMVTHRYKVINVEDLVALLSETLPGATVEVSHASSGVHGGIATIRLSPQGTEDEPGAFQACIEIDAGAKNGITSIRGTALAEILKCQNQLTLEVANIVGGNLELPRLATGFRIVHAGDYNDALKTAVGDFAGGPLNALGDIISTSQLVPVDEERMGKVLGFYRKVKRISRRTADLVRDTWAKGAEIQQVQNTLYGLAMAVTYVGTHEKERAPDGVRERLRQLGGELILLGGQFDKFYSVAVENQPPPDPEPKPKKVKAPKPKKEKTPKQPKAKKVKKVKAVEADLPDLPTDDE